jgi:hypothetical protein
MLTARFWCDDRALRHDVPRVRHRSVDRLAPHYVAPLITQRAFGLELDASVEVRVWDSSAEVRYLVLLERPLGSEDLSEVELAALVTRDAMIGVTKVVALAVSGR